ncbi:hypothetical protein K9N50_02660 [bacterium]|nr:hypothetical protein [bacterium]
MNKNLIKKVASSCFSYFLSLALIIFFLAGCAAQKEEISALPEEQPDSLEVVEGEIEPELDLGQVAEVADQSVQITFGDYHNGLGSFSPTGNKVIFQSSRDSVWQIYEIDLEDKSEQRIIISDANDENPVWTTDGSRIIFVSDRNSNNVEWERDIYLYDPTTGETIALTETPSDDWYPVPIDEGSFIFLTEREADDELDVYYKQNALYMGFIDGTESIKIAGANINPSAPVSWKENKFILRTSDAGLAVWSYDDGSMERLTPSSLKCGTSTINREKDWLVFCAREDDKYKLYLLDLNTNTLQLIDTQGIDVRYPQISPDGSLLLYTAEINGYFQMFTIDLER